MKKKIEEILFLAISQREDLESAQLNAPDHCLTVHNNYDNLKRSEHITENNKNCQMIKKDADTNWNKEWLSKTHNENCFEVT